MKVLVTGATGFLGKHVLGRLVADERVTALYVVSRKARSHPSPKVQVAVADLADPRVLDGATCEVDAIVHLAGLYDFGATSFTENYRQNVLATLNVIDRLRAPERMGLPLPLVVHASTYAVGLGSDQPLPEAALETLPPQDCPYAYTKALAERAVAASGLPARVLRLGVLVGDSRTGDIEKLDGPYAVMRLLRRAARIPGAGAVLKAARAIPGFRGIPVPIRADAVMPLVPVDSAARIVHESLFLPQPQGCEYHGVYRPDSVRLDQLTRALFDRFLPGSRPAFAAGGFPRWLIPLQTRVTGIPADNFRFTLDPVALGPVRTAEVFGPIPAFEQYSDTMFREYERWFS